MRDFTQKSFKKRLQPAEASVFAAEICDYLAKLFFRKIWPKRGRKGKLGVASLPKHKIWQSLLAAGAHEKVDGCWLVEAGLQAIFA